MTIHSPELEYLCNEIIGEKDGIEIDNSADN